MTQPTQKAVQATIDAAGRIAAHIETMDQIEVLELLAVANVACTNDTRVALAGITQLTEPP